MAKDVTKQSIEQPGFFERRRAAALRAGKQRGLAPAVAAMRRRLHAAASSEQPVVFGPWLSEVGYEILYWIPFLRWAVKEYSIDPGRVTIVSRGGVSKWYSGLSKGYADIFNLMSPDEFRRLNDERQKSTGMQKHTFVSEFDHHVLEKLDLAGGLLVHPDIMYGLMDDYWSGAAGFSRYTDHIAYSRMKPPPHAIVKQLPESYTAVKFYSRLSLPMTDENRKQIDRYMLALADEGPVVAMNTGLAADDHGDFAPPRHPNIVSILEWVTPSDNLVAQSAVVARAREVHCTYGGFAYLPLLYGVPAAGFYSVDKHFMKIHGRAAYWLSTKMKSPLSVTHVSHISRLGRLHTELGAKKDALGISETTAEEYKSDAELLGKRLDEHAIESSREVHRLQASLEKEKAQRDDFKAKYFDRKASFEATAEKLKASIQKERAGAEASREKYAQHVAATGKALEILREAAQKEKDKTDTLKKQYFTYRDNTEAKIAALKERSEKLQMTRAARYQLNDLLYASFDIAVKNLRRGENATPAGAEILAFDQLQVACPNAREGDDWIVDKLRRLEKFPLKEDQLFLLAMHGKHGGVMIDIGANLGLTIIPPLLLNLVSNVIGIEPSKQNFDLLSWNIEVNGLLDRVTLHRAALGKAAGESSLAVTAASGLHHMHSDAATDEIAQETVSVLTVDKLIADHGVRGSVSFIKCDTQGAEAQILGGASETLTRRDSIWEIEFWPHGINLLNDDPKDVLEIVEKYFSWFSDEKLKSGEILPISKLRESVGRLKNIQHTDLFLIP